jgi:predicted O-linked N-acetylglucosamine transferase (SPINDLY family)
MNRKDRRAAKRMRPAGLGAQADIERLFASAQLEHQAGHLAEASRLYERILARDPRNAPSLYFLGVLAHQDGRAAAAADLFARAIAIDRQVPEWHYDRALVLLALARRDEAAGALEQAIAVKPDFAEAHLQLGNVLLEQRRFDAAAGQFRNALACRPGLVAAHTNLGSILFVQGKLEEATDHWRHAVALAPNSPGAIMNMGLALKKQGKPKEAVSYFRRALSLDPDLAEAHVNLANALYMQNELADAATHFERTLALKPNNAEARFGLCMSLPRVLYASEAEIVAQREAYMRQLRLLAESADRDWPVGELAPSIGYVNPFYLPYQGYDDREPQRLYGTLACRAMASHYPPARLTGPPAPGEPVKVGFVSSFFFAHTVWKLMLRGWLTMLDRKRFRLFGYHTTATRDAVTQAAAGLCERFVIADGRSAEDWRETILADAPHVLVYPELGMDPMCIRLATQRLAPVQCMSWGHPQTSGFPTIDYFVSSDAMEPPDGDAHYTEKLVRLPNSSIYYQPTEFTPVSIGRSELGLRADAVVFWSAQALFKYLPQHDDVFARIAREVGNCQFVFLAHQGDPRSTDLFRRRLDEAFSRHGLAAGDHCVVLPRLDYDRFIAAAGVCDVVLDSLGWSGGTSTLETLAHDLPIVTWPGPLMRGRHSAGFLQVMGVTQTIAATVDDYVAIAVRLARDPGWRMEIRRRVASSKDRLLRDRSCIAAFEDFLDSVAREQPRRPDAAQADRGEP